MIARWRATWIGGLIVAMIAAAAPRAFADEATTADIPVPKNIIYAGQMVDESLIMWRRVPVRYLRRVQVFESVDEVVGKMARTTLMPNRPIAINHLRKPDIIKASVPVEVFYKAGNLVIRGTAIPLSGAAVGEALRARNVDTGVVIIGIAQPDGTLLAIR